MGHVPMADDKKVVLICENEPPSIIFSEIRRFFNMRLPPHERNLSIEEWYAGTHEYESLLTIVRLAQARDDIVVIEYGLLARFARIIANGIWTYQRVGDGYAFSYFDGSFRDAAITSTSNVQ